MKDLSEVRKTIDRIDREMAQLFLERMEASRQVAEYKKETGMPIFDPAREEEVLARGSTRVEDETLRAYYVNFLRANMEISKAYQARLLCGMQVAYAGTRGAFAYLAAKKIFPHAVPVGFGNFEEAYRAVESGQCDVAVLPLENSTNGDVGTVMDLAHFGSLSVNGVYRVEVVQNLLAKPGVELSEIRTVASHPQALGQCSLFLGKMGWEKLEMENTALAAREVARSSRRDLAAVGSEEAAEEYGLQVLRSHIQDRGGNTTRFAVFSRVGTPLSSGDSRFMMTFTVKNEAGALAQAVSAIGSAGFNLRAIKSRPTKKLSWEYYFFCEGEGNLFSPEGYLMLENLKQVCNDVNVLGAFQEESIC